MSITSLVGRKLVVSYSFLKDLHIEFSQQEGKQLLTVEGTIMESAKVFETLKLVRRGNTIFITVYASMPFWKGTKSPDFNQTKTMNLPQGTYDIQYKGKKKDTTFIKKVKVEV